MYELHYLEIDTINIIELNDGVVAETKENEKRCGPKNTGKKKKSGRFKKANERNKKTDKYDTNFGIF